jgi:hypothetical protein
MQELQPHQQRVVEEYDQLKERTSKLSQFILDNPIFLDLPIEEKADLEIQYESMCKYQDALERRIKRF